MKTAIASWSVYLSVHCPHCDEYIDVKFDEQDEWWSVFDWPPHSSDKVDHEMDCQECGKTFKINGTEY